MTIRDGVREVALSAVIFALLSYSWMYSEISGPNERTRVYLTAALVDDRTIQIDRSLARFGGVYDLASHDGHFFTDKAPGSSFLAAPIYALARRGDPPEAWPAERIINLTRNWLMIPLGVLGFVLLRWLLRRLERDPRTVDLVSIAYAVGCAVFHYTTAFYGHVIVATLLLGALSCLAGAGVLTQPRDPPPRIRLGLLALAGLLAGLAGLTEYQATLLAGILALPTLLCGPARWKAALAYLAGGLPCALALLAYNRAAFGGAFELSYQHLVGQALQQMHGSGLAGATMPTREAVLGLLFSAHRGIVTTSPWLAFGLLGLARGMRREARVLWLTTVIACAYLFLAVASSSVWHGGWAFGPRLLIPAMPLLAISAAYFIDHMQRFPLIDVLARASALFAIVYQQLVQVTFSELPPEMWWPLRESVGPVLHAGGVAPNLACKLHPLGLKNLLPLAAIVLALLLFLALPPKSRWPGRTARALGTLLIAAAMMLALWRVEPNTLPHDQAGWAGWITGMMQRETRCAGLPPDLPPPPPPPPPPPAQP